MLSYKRIKEISKMFDPSVNVSLYDPANFDEDLDWNYPEFDYPLSEFYAELPDPLEFSRSFDEEPLSPQSQIRNHDCMWSGRCTTHPNECLSSRTNCTNKYVNEVDMKKSQTMQTTATNNSNNTNSSTISTSSTTQLTNQNRINTINAATSIGQQKKSTQVIPQGRSLLRLNQAKQGAVIKLPTVSTNDFLKDRDDIARPDTPLSLDDDAPEFKHHIDIASCTIGSNRTDLDSETHNEYINILKEHLENENSNHLQIQSKLSTFMPTLTKSKSIDDLLEDIKSFSDYENELDEDDDEEEHANESDSTVDSSRITSTQSSMNSTTLYENTQSMHSDHSYTRSKMRVDINGLGVQTPSDSEEEIDVVSVGDKNLPTNPSAKDRRALQTTVAHKISAGIVKTTSKSIRTITPRRRSSNTSSDSSGYSSSKLNSSFTHQMNDTIQTSLAQQQSHNTTPNASRKRANPKSLAVVAAAISQSGNNQNAKRSKLSNSKKLANGSVIATSTPNSNHTLENAIKRSQIELDGSDTVEKRNLHNDMERQRRIGLKNLFENLKEKIPSLRDKERAPKVNILREATILCNQLTEDENEYEALRRKNQRLLQRLKQLRGAKN